MFFDFFGWRHGLRNRFFASLCFRDVHREMGLSLSRSLESTKTSERSLFSFRTLSQALKHVPQEQFTMPFVQYVKQFGALYFWEGPRTSRSTPWIPCCGSFPSTAPLNGLNA